MAESNSFSSSFGSTDQSTNPKTTPKAGKSSTDYKSDTSSFGADSNIMGDAEHLYEEGMEQIKKVAGFVKENWIMIASVGAVLGVSAFLLRKRLPLIGKKRAASRSGIKLPGLKAAARAVKGHKSVTRSHH